MGTQARQGRQNVAHGDSRGKETPLQLLCEPRQGRKNVFGKRVVRDFCRPCRGSYLFLRIIPTAGAMGHNLPPLRGLSSFACFLNSEITKPRPSGLRQRVLGI